MAYLSLYRRWRPTTFKDMMGQEHVCRTLSNALSQGKLAHAYLFCGPRGTGKTTAAKILARAVNCERYPAPDPCGACASCRNIAAGISLDVIEMDAASNRGIDEIRELRERTRYASAEGRFKVYIIDEAHMLTSEAFNAFLKTLEEPPPGVIFILATTDPARLPPTIISRCQRFDFHLLTVGQIRQYLHQVMVQEKWQGEDEALYLMARLAEGSMRDALGILEQCQVFGVDGITAEQVRSVTGATRVETMAQFVEAVAANSLPGGFRVLAEVVYSGRDLTLFIRDLTFIFSRLLLGKEAAAEESYFGFEAILERYRDRFPAEALYEAIEILYRAGGELRQGHFPQYILEVALIRIMRAVHGNPDKGAASEAPSPGFSPERDSGAAPVSRQQAARPPRQDRRKEEGPSPEAQKTDPAGDLLEQFQRDWDKILQEVKKKQKSTWVHLACATPHRYRGEQLVLAYDPDSFLQQERIMEQGHRKVVEQVLNHLYKKEIRVKTMQLPRDALPGQPAVELPEPEPGDDLFNEAVKLFTGQVFDAQEKEE